MFDAVRKEQIANWKFREAAFKVSRKAKSSEAELGAEANWRSEKCIRDQIFALSKELINDSKLR